jgi:hypothetical protein
MSWLPSWQGILVSLAAICVIRAVWIWRKYDDHRFLRFIAELARQRNDEAARTLAADIKIATPTPMETARLLVTATIEVAIEELTSGRRLPRLRTALLAMVPERNRPDSVSGR